MDDILARLNAIHITLNFILLFLGIIAGSIIWGNKRR